MDELDGFLFAVADEGDLNTSIVKNDDSGNTLWLDNLLGVLILGIARTHDVDTARIGHMAVQFTLEHMDV